MISELKGLTFMEACDKILAFGFDILEANPSFAKLVRELIQFYFSTRDADLYLVHETVAPTYKVVAGFLTNEDALAFVATMPGRLYVADLNTVKLNPPLTPMWRVKFSDLSRDDYTVTRVTHMENGNLRDTFYYQCDTSLEAVSMALERIKYLHEGKK